MLIATTAWGRPAAADPPGAGGGTDTPAQSTLTSLVDPFVGTGVNPVTAGEVGTFPGADVPFGMIQWSPDTTPGREQGGGYDFADDKISGFSLTHLSGAGCPVFGDLPILPTTGAMPGDPAHVVEPFSHDDESASPGRYQVRLGSPSMDVQLATTTRTGIGEITYPSTRSANVLFKVSGSANGVHSSAVQIHGTNEVTGSVTTGYFCDSFGSYTLHFVAEFNRPFESHGIWEHGRSHPGSSACSGSYVTACGGWVTFGTAHSRSVTMKVGVSYVSAADAAANLKAEDPGWSLDGVQQQATRSWNTMLDRIDVQGGSRAQQQIFYTALYHCLLDPSVFSDDNGEYEGADGRVHNAGHHVQYTNFSEWDIYRSEIPLLAMIAPQRVSDMMQSLVNDAAQSGWLPKWELANYDSGSMDGDSADPILASAYAFGVRGFDASAALKAMLKGADRPGTGPDYVQERQGLPEYEASGFVRQGAEDQAMGATVGGSETLEYAIDDFAVAQMAAYEGDQSDYRTMMARAQNWQNLFNPATGYVQARLAAGSFPSGPAFPPPTAALRAENQAQNGFEEGNAIQYTWSVPQNLGDLFALMGGDSAATANLDQLFTQLNAGPFLAYDWAGNEPSLGTPWEFDYSGAPWRTQQVVRSIADSLYTLTPAGEPGNDDLGAMASWYVWAALGLYPLTPGTANLVTASPLFPSSTIHLAGGKELTVQAVGAPATYVTSAEVTTGAAAPAPLDQPWLPASILHTGGTISFTLGSAPDTAWGAAPGSAPPSYSESAAPAVAYTSPTGVVPAAVGAPTAVTLGLQSDVAGPTTVLWSASGDGVSLTPSSGQLVLPAATAGTYPRADTTLQLTASAAGTRDVQFRFSVPGSSVRIPSITVQVTTP
jgi:predicted alpha-1,2-mannosidase